MEFTADQADANFATLDEVLSGEIDIEKGNTIREFVDFYGEGINYQANKVRFENTGTFTRMVELLETTKPPMLAELLRLLMVYSRAGWSYFTENFILSSHFEFVLFLFFFFLFFLFFSPFALSSSLTEMHQKYIQKLEGIAVVVKTMQTYGSDLDVLEQGCRAFINIGSNGICYCCC